MLHWFSEAFRALLALVGFAFLSDLTLQYTGISPEPRVIIVGVLCIFAACWLVLPRLDDVGGR